MTRTHVFVVALAVCLFAVPGAGAQGPPPGGAVTLPLEDYQALRARARQAGATPPARATLTRIDYALPPTASWSPARRGSRSTCRARAG